MSNWIAYLQQGLGSLSRPFFNKTVILQEGNILLRPLRIEDQEAVATLANNKKVWNNLRDLIPHPYTRADAAQFIGLTQQESPQLTFAILCDEHLCGVIGLVPQADIYRISAEIGYWLGEPFWGKGIATTAVKLMTQYGFEYLKLKRIYTGVFEYNTASMRVLEKNGYHKDCIFRQALIKNGKVWDEHRFSIIKEQLPST
jgi:RimJ/RimL family protein N-acetyltransferase